MRAPIFRGRVEKGRIVLDNRDRFRSYLASFETKRIELVLRERRTERSDQQNSYYWAIVVGMLADHIGNEKEEMHEILKQKFKIKSTATLKTKEFEEYIANIVRFAASELHFVIPSPNEVDY